MSFLLLTDGTSHLDLADGTGDLLLSGDVPELSMDPAILEFEGMSMSPLMAPAEMEWEGGEPSAGPVGPAQTVQLAPSISDSYSAGLFVDGGEETPDLVLKLFRRDDLETPVLTIEDARNVKFQDQLNEPGSGELTVQNLVADPDDPGGSPMIPHPLIEALEDDDIIVAEVKGYRTWAMVAHKRNRTSISPQEEAGETTVISGEGHLSILAEADVYPRRLEAARALAPLNGDVRSFNWTSPDFDDTGWVAAKEIVAVDATSAYWTGFPEGFVITSTEGTLTGQVFWLGTTTATDTNAPVGTSYARMIFPTFADEGQIKIFFGADNRGEVWLDGEQVIATDENTGPTKAYSQSVKVDEGGHLLAVSWTNDPGDPPNPGAFVLSAFVEDQFGELGRPVAFSAQTHGPDDPDWVMVAFPEEPPGMTAGEIMIHCINEAKARPGTALAGVTPMFTRDTDSDGVPWPQLSDMATRVGTDCLSFFREISATYMDFWMGPAGFELYAWVKDGRGETKPVMFERAVNLRSLTHDLDTAVTNTLLVRWSGGWREVLNQASIDDKGRREARLDLGALQSAAEVDRVGHKQLEIYADRREAITAEIVPVDETQIPPIAFDVGDTVTVPDSDGNPVQERVMSITYAMDGDRLTFAPELKDIRLQSAERWEQALKKKSDGTFRGDSKVATPSSPLPPHTQPIPAPVAATGLPGHVSIRGTQSISSGTGTIPTADGLRISSTGADYFEEEDISGATGLRVLQDCDVWATFIASFQTNATGVRGAEVQFLAGGTGFTQTPVGDQDSAATSGSTSLSATGPLILQADDLIALQLSQTSGTSLSVTWVLSLMLLERLTG